MVPTQRSIGPMQRTAPHLTAPQRPGGRSRRGRYAPFAWRSLTAASPCHRRPMPHPPPRDLPVLLLGKHVTALGVLRTLARRGIEVLGAETTTDVITRSRFYRRAEA